MIAYTVTRSVRRSSIRLKVMPGAIVEVVAPYWSTTRHIEEVLHAQQEWIRSAVARTADRKRLPVSGRRAYIKHKEQARAFITERVRHWNQYYQFSYGRIAIKDTKRSWGSCSAQGNLNFSYLLLFLPRELADYVVVHELCHLREHNHSPRFWALVEQTVPDYRVRRRELKKFVLK